LKRNIISHRNKMGILNKAYKKILAEAEKARFDITKKNGSKNEGFARVGSVTSIPSARSSSVSMTMSEVLHYSTITTRWEKAVVATNAIVGEVMSFDPDGVDIVVVGGDDNKNDNITRHPNITTSVYVENTITQQNPGGPCLLGAAMEEVLHKALNQDLEAKPCSILVLTAGKPDDSERLQNCLKNASQTVASKGGIEKCPLSITFIQIGTDEDTSKYLKFLDKKMVGISESTNEKVDIIDTMDYRELQQAMQNIKEYNASMEKEANKKGITGAIVGGVAGAAIGIGGMYLSKNNKKADENESWGGSWKCLQEDDEIATLEVRDDGKGNLSIDGLLDDETISGRYSGGPGAVTITVAEPEGKVEGTPDDASNNCVLKFDDGTRWVKDVPKSNNRWSGCLGAAAAVGAAALSATGYAIDKKFFRKVGDNVNSDYVLVLDRSAAMDPTTEEQAFPLAQ